MTCDAIVKSIIDDITLNNSPVFFFIMKKVYIIEQRRIEDLYNERKMYYILYYIKNSKHNPPTGKHEQLFKKYNSRVIFITHLYARQTSVLDVRSLA